MTAVPMTAQAVTARLFAAAAESVGADQWRGEAATAGDLRAGLGRVSDDAARVVRQCALLRTGERLDDDAALVAGDVIDVLPPFAGG